MSLAQALLLGLVQGLTEFLPISSTAHLILLPRFFKFPDPGLVFDIALHLGTLLAILIYFRKEWEEIVQALVRARGGTKFCKESEPFVPHKNFRADLSAHSLLKLLLIATFPGLFFGFLFESWAETGLRSPFLIATTLAVFGLILWLVDSKFKHLNDLNHLSKKEALLIGLWQALAIIPGVSRSGATITAGLLVGLKREAAVRFSFLLSAPIILGSALGGIVKTTNYQLLATNYSLVGILASFLSSMLAIKFLLNFVKNRSFLPFVIYRIILAILVFGVLV